MSDEPIVHVSGGTVSDQRKDLQKGSFDRIDKFIREELEVLGYKSGDASVAFFISALRADSREEHDYEVTAGVFCRSHPEMVVSLAKGMINRGKAMVANVVKEVLEKT